MFHLSNSRTTWCVYALVMAATCLFTFENLFTQDFWDGADDQSIMTDIAMLSQDLSLIISPKRDHDARPPFDLVVLGGYLIWGENPAAFHMFHIGLHLLASLLAAFTLHRLGTQLELSLLTGLFFLLNVAHFRAVHWITSINYALALIFCLWVLICYQSFETKRNNAWMIAGLCALVLAVLTHPAASFIAFFCAYLTYQKQTSIKQALKNSWPLLLAAPILVLYAHLISVHGQSDAALTTPEVSRIIKNIFWYLGRLVTTAHWISRTTSQNEPHTWELAIGLIALLGMGVLYRKRLYLVTHWAIWCLLCILPFLNNPPARLAVGPSRHLYFATLGSSFILAWALYALALNQKKWLSENIRRMVFLALLLLIISSSIVSLKRAEAISIYLTAISNKARALELFERAARQAPTLVPLDIYKRMVYEGFLSGKIDPQILETALQQNPDNAQIHILWAATALLQDSPEHHEQAQKYIQNIISRSTDPAEMKYYAAVVLQNLAVYFTRQNNIDRAIEIYEQVLAFHPDYPLALYRLGELYRNQNKDRQAIETFQRVVAIEPNHKLALRNLAEMLFLCGQYEEALQVFIKATQADPQNNVLHFNLAQTLVALGRLTEALPIFKAIIQENPQDQDTHLALGWVYEHLGKQKEAIQAYQNVLHLNPDHQVATSRLQALQQPISQQ